MSKFKPRLMPKKDAIKHLQNLFSWNEFYVKLGIYNKKGADKVEKEIEIHKNIYGL
jgi:hypothetical protein